MADVRAQFDGCRDKTFLDAACVSLAPRAATDAIHRFLQMTAVCDDRSATDHHIEMDRLRAEARPQAARLINAGEDEIALVESTTHGLGIAAETLPLGRGDRVVVCDLEFLEVAVPWCQRLARDGIEVDVVPNRDGRLLVDDIVAALTPRTKVVTISTVQWSNGFRCDLAGLSRACRDAGVWLIVDAIQQLGGIPLDVQDTPVDMLACGGHKWLNSPYGTGFLYVRRDLLGDLRAPLAGYLSLETPAGGWGEYFQTPSITPVRDYRFVDAAQRLEIGGTANYPGAIGLAASLELINSLGPQRRADHILALTDHLIQGLQELDVQVVTPPERESRSGIVTFSVGGAPDNVELMEHLLDNRILVSVRYTSQIGGVRVSCHVYNGSDDIDRLLNVVAEWRRQRGPASPATRSK